MLVGAWLEGADLRGADLTGADLSGAFLSRANLTGARLTETDLTNANLTGADLTDADLSDADATSANFRGARLYATKLDNAAIETQQLVYAFIKSPAPQSRKADTYRVETCPVEDLEETLNRGATQGWSLVSVMPDVGGDNEWIGTAFVVVWVTQSGS